MTSAVADASRNLWVVLTESLVSSLFVFGSNIIAVSLPRIGRSLEASFAVVQWVISYCALILSASVRLRRCARRPPKDAVSTDRLA